ICLKCLEKDPRRRYASAEALAEDLERWLGGEPILARPSTARERAVKWVKRRPAAAAPGGGSLAAAAAPLGVGLVYDARLAEAARDAEVQREEARLEREGARQANEAVRVAQAEAEQDRETARRAETESRGNLYRSRVGLARTEWLTSHAAHGA